MERRQAVGRRAAADRRVGIGDEGVERVAVALRVASGQGGVAGADSRAGSRGTISCRSRAPTQRVSGASWSNAIDVPAASISNHRRFLRPGEIWLTTRVPAAPRSVSNIMVAASSPATVTRCRSPVARWKALAWPASRSAKAVIVRAESRAMRWPVTNSIRSHQCEPMSANARDGPPSTGSTRQL